MYITIVEPDYKILTSPIGLVQHLELCGRTCYKSEDKITTDSSEAFCIGLIKRGHESVLEHASMTVRIICDRACSHQLVRHRIGAYCLAGDTVVPGFISSGTRSKKWTLKQLYQWSLDPKRNCTFKTLRLRSVDTQGVLVPNKIKSVIDSGVQGVYKVTTEFGRQIKATLNHRFLTPSGYKSLSELKVGNGIIANGVPACDNPEWVKNHYLIQNKSAQEVADLAKVSKSYLKTKIKEYGLNKSQNEYEKRAKSKNIGHLHGSYKGLNVALQTGRWRAQSLYKTPISCSRCNTNGKPILRHHKDHDPINNEPENIMFVCSSCHKQWHIGQGVLSVFTDTIVSIEADGVTDTYDIEMEAPHHNFVANGFLVHNSQESQRYCSYKNLGFQFIAPKSLGIPVGEYQLEGETRITRSGLKREQCQWLENRTQNCLEYLSLLKDGMRPEDARSVLPNATKTEVVTTYNIRQWRHVFRERALNPHAQWQIKGIMLGILEEFNQSMPSLFGDLK